MFKQKDQFQLITPVNSNVSVADGYTLTSDGIRDVQISANLNNNMLQNVLYVPTLQHNLLLVHILTKEGNDVTFKRGGTVTLTNEDYVSMTIGTAAIDDLYHLTVNTNNSCTFTATTTTSDYTLWHHHLGHPG